MCNRVYTVYACGHSRYREHRRCGYYRRRGRCFYADQAVDLEERSRRTCTHCLLEAGVQGFLYSWGKR